MSGTYHNLAAGALSQDWTDTSLIAGDDNWDGVPSIIGYRGDDLTGATGTDPQTITATSTVVDVIANQANPNTLATGGVAEFAIADPTIALQGSGTADAPHIVIHLDATGRQNVTLDLDLRDIDGSADNAAQQVAVQYRIGETGAWTNLPAGYVADATTGGSATQVTHLSVTLPAAANDQAQVQVRVITTNAVGSDEWVGLDNIVVDSQAITVDGVSVTGMSVTEGDAGTQLLTFTVTRTGTANAFTIDYDTADAGATAGQDYVGASGTLTFLEGGPDSQTVQVTINGDTDVEPDEIFNLVLSNLVVTSGDVTIVTDTAEGAIQNDDTAAPSLYHSLAGGDFSQDWSDTALIGAADDWSGVASIIGYRGDDLTTSTGTDPRTIANTSDVVDVNANQAIPNTFGTGGVAEFEIADPTVALQGSGTADAPYIVVHLDATGRQNLHLDLDLRDIDGSADNAIQQVAVQYRVGETGAWTNVPGGYVADATTGGSATQVTHLSLDLPAEVNGQSQVQVRVMTTNAGGNDEWVGVDNIHVTSAALGPSVSISNVTVAEGDAGETLMTFDVTRTDPGAALSVDFATADGTATAAGNDYEAQTGTLTFTAGGPNTQTVTVVVNGDGTVEPNEDLTVTLSNVVNTTGATAIADGSATGTIQNDDVGITPIAAIQGAGHASPFAGQTVTTEGIVTAIDNGGTTHGFWIQMATGDGDTATSDAVFVFLGAGAPTVAVGQTVRVTGLVTEFGSGNNLTTTELTGPGLVVSIQNGGALSPLPAATVIGAGGRTPPTSVIEDDGFTSYDPATDGTDFYESMEGMRVTIPDAQAVAGTDDGSTWVVGDAGAGATGLNDRGGVTIQADDFNPERINVFVDDGVLPAVAPVNAVMGDSLGDVTGVVGYFNGNYEVIATAIGATPAGQPLPRETTALDGDADQVTVAAYNVENLDPNDPQAKFDRLAQDIAVNLGAPDIIGLEEIQDSNGGAPGGDLSGAATANKLIQAIVAAGGPTYVYVEVAPATANSSGGEPNANIRQGYLYNPARVEYVEGSAELITGAAYDGTRKPLAAEFSFHGETLTLIDLHSTSRLGSDQLFGDVQPPQNAGDAARIAQSQGVKAYVDGLLAADPGAKIVVMGDFNGFQFETSLTLLEAGGALTNLSGLLAPEERYSYVFEGNSQQIDHMLASQGLAGGAEFDIVHLNTGQPAAGRATDHDAVLGRFLVNTAPVADNDSYGATEDSVLVVDAEHGVTANDTDVNGDTLTAVLDQGPQHGALTLNANGSFSYAPAANYNGPDSFTYHVQDPTGAVSAVRTVSLQVGAVNDAPVAVGDAASVSENQSVTIDVLVNDTDVDAGDTKAIVSVSATASGGHVSIVDGQLVYVADADAFDLLTAGEQASDSFSYVIQDAAGATSTATVMVTITGVADGPTQLGGNGKDTLTGTDGEERLEGGNGVDRLVGGGGADTLSGGAGADELIGGAGADRLEGGNGPDVFEFTGAFGHDTIVDLENADRIRLDDAQFADFAAVLANAAQAGGDVVITLDAANSITLAGVQLSSLAANDFLFV